MMIEKTNQAIKNKEQYAIEGQTANQAIQNKERYAIRYKLETHVMFQQLHHDIKLFLGFGRSRLSVARGSLEAYGWKSHISKFDKIEDNYFVGLFPTPCLC